MKPFNLVIGLVLIFLIGGYNVLCDSSIKDVSIGQANFHSIQKRQVNSSISRQCQRITTSQQCTSGYVQALYSLSLQCDQSQTAENFQDSCRQNSMGDYCGVATTYIQDIQAILRACPNSMSTCSTQCKGRLVNIRDELGCCINVIFNQTRNMQLYAAYGPAFQYSLWSSCELEGITNNCTSVIESLPVPVDPSCDVLSYQEQMERIQCERRYIEPTLNALSSESTCQLFYQSTLEQCGVNEVLGRSCLELLPVLETNFSVAFRTCRNTSICEPLCRSILENFKASAGCCINNFYNSSITEISGTRYDFLSYEYWLLCGLDTPGICEPQLTGPTTEMPSTSDDITQSSSTTTTQNGSSSSTTTTQNGSSSSTITTQNGNTVFILLLLLVSYIM